SRTSGSSGSSGTVPSWPSSCSGASRTSSSPPTRSARRRRASDDAAGAEPLQLRAPEAERLSVDLLAGDRLLVARLHEPPGGAAARPVGAAAEAAQIVADARRLDLDHLGAEFAEERRAERRGQIRREVEHGDAGEPRGGVGHALILPASC